MAERLRFPFWHDTVILANTSGILPSIYSNIVNKS
jgi:hypothetical protein